MSQELVASDSSSEEGKGGTIRSQTVGPTSRLSAMEGKTDRLLYYMIRLDTCSPRLRTASRTGHDSEDKKAMHVVILKNILKF